MSKYPNVLEELEESRVDMEVSFYCSLFTFRLELIALFLFIESSLPENIYLFRTETSGIGYKKSTKGGRPAKDNNEKISDGRARRTTVGDTECEYNILFLVSNVWY